MEQKEAKKLLRCKNFTPQKTGQKHYGPQFGCIFHDPVTRVAVATDAHILFANPDEYKEIEGNHLLKCNGRPVNSDWKFSKWQNAVLTARPNYPATLRADLEEVFNDCQKKLQVNFAFKVCKNGYIASYYVPFVIAAGLDGWRKTETLCDDESCLSALLKQWEGKTLLIMGVLPDENHPNEDYFIM